MREKPRSLTEKVQLIRQVNMAQVVDFVVHPSDPLAQARHGTRRAAILQPVRARRMSSSSWCTSSTPSTSATLATSGAVRGRLIFGVAACVLGHGERLVLRLRACSSSSGAAPRDRLRRGRQPPAGPRGQVAASCIMHVLSVTEVMFTYQKFSRFLVT
jgi:hypothetical protein